MEIIARMTLNGDYFNWIDSDKLTPIIEKINSAARSPSKRTKKLGKELLQEVLDCVDINAGPAKIGSDNEVDYWFNATPDEKREVWKALDDLACRHEELMNPE